MPRILLADDSVTMQKVVELVLTGEGYEVRSVPNGEDALAAMEEFHPDIILADTDMPVLNGYQVSKRVKDSPYFRDIPVILLASAFEPLDEALAAEAGADGTLIKPFESEDLLGKITSLLSAGEAQVPAGEAAREEAVEEVLEAEDLAGARAEEEDLWAMESFDVEEAVEAEPLEELAEEAVEAAIPEDMGTGETRPEETLEEQPAPEEAPEMAEPPEAGDLAEVFREAALERIDGALAGLDLRRLVLDVLEPGLKDAVEKVLWEVTPDLVEKLLKETMAETMGTLRKELENVIWETVPDLAESIIRKEIEAIRAEST